MFNSEIARLVDFLCCVHLMLRLRFCDPRFPIALPSGEPYKRSCRHTFSISICRRASVDHALSRCAGAPLPAVVREGGVLRLRRIIFGGEACETARTRRNPRRVVFLFARRAGHYAWGWPYLYAALGPSKIVCRYKVYAHCWRVQDRAGTSNNTCIRAGSFTPQDIIVSCRPPKN